MTYHAMAESSRVVRRRAARALAWRRACATGVDYGLAAGWALALLGIAVTVGAHRELTTVDPLTGQLLGLTTMTLPVTAALAVFEARGGTPGKRLLGLRVETAAGGRPSQGRALARTTAKVTLPWELAHAGVWQFSRGDDTAAMVVTIAAYLVAGAGAVGLLMGRTWYDRLCATRVVGE